VVQRLVDIARTCSPRVSQRAEHVVTLDIDGLTRLFGHHRAVAEQLRRTASDGGYPLVHVAVAATQTAAILLASMRPGITVVEDGEHAAALAPLPLRSLEVLTDTGARGRGQGASLGLGAPAFALWATADKRGSGLGPKEKEVARQRDTSSLVPSPQSLAPSLSRWGIRTLGQLAALPAVELSERLGQAGVTWQRWARGEDLEPLVPALDDEIFDATFEPEWPIENAEALSHVMARMLTPLCERLARRDRAAAVLHLRLRLVTRDVHTRSLQLPAPLRDPEVLRTLIMLALEAHPAPAGIDVVTIAVDPTPGRVVQESLLTRALPPPEHVATLMARLGALMGERRCGSPALVDSHRPGMFAMVPFCMEQGHGTWGMGHGRGKGPGVRDVPHVPGIAPTPSPQSPTPSVSLRRFRLPISARVVVEHGRPVSVRTERQNLQGGQVRMCAGPWRMSGGWWKTPGTPPSELDKLRGRAGWNRDEWDVALNDGGIYRIFEDRDSGRWFVEGMVD
jgi:protein ImuB